MEAVSAEALPDDPRLLGRALAVLRAGEGSARDAHSWWVQGRIEQRLHQFEQARASLARASELAPASQRYPLWQFHVALAQGDAPAAQRFCDRLAAVGDSLVHASCRAQWQLAFADPAQAQRLIEEALASNAGGSVDRTLVEARITHAQVLTALDHHLAVSAWLWVLSHAPETLFARQQLALLLLEQGRHSAAERLTRGHEGHLGLAVVRAASLKRLGLPEAEQLEARLQREWRLWRWRGEDLHRADFVRYLLWVSGDRRAALQLAQEGWLRHPGPDSRRLLVSVARQVGDTDLLARLKQGDRTDAMAGTEARF